MAQAAEPGLRPARLIVIALSAGVVLLPSCLSLPVPGRDSALSRDRLTSKVVVEKREPGLLLAADRSECQVSPERFERVREGERVFCHWRFVSGP